LISFLCASGGKAAIDMILTPTKIVPTEAQRTIRLEMDGLSAVDSALDKELGQKIAATLTSTGTPAHFVHPSEASHGDLGMIQEQDVVVALSWSGEAPELSDVIAYTRRFRVPLVAITSRPDSTLGKSADIALILPIMPEACPNGLAPTTSTTMQMALGDAIAVTLLSRRGFSANDFFQFHPGGKLGSQLRTARDLMHVGDAVPTVPEAAVLSEAIMVMTGKRFGITAVVDDTGKLSGVITDGDLRRAFDSGGFAERQSAEIMTRSPHTIAPETLAPQILAELNRAAITAIFVVEDGMPIGILNIHDLLRAGVA